MKLKINLFHFLDSVDGSEAKALFATHYSHIYHLVYEGIVSAEGSLKLRGGLFFKTILIVCMHKCGDRWWHFFRPFGRYWQKIVWLTFLLEKFAVRKLLNYQVSFCPKNILYLLKYNYSVKQKENIIDYCRVQKSARTHS